MVELLSFEKIKIFYLKYERYLSAIALLTGFVVDNLTLKRIDFLFENLVLFSYLVIAGGGIATMQLHRSARVKGVWFEKLIVFFPLFIQFAFGGLFSAFFVFYSRSGSLTGSILFLMLILALLVGNEFFRIRYQKFVFQVSIFYTALFSFAIFFVPVLIGSMGTIVFLASGLVSLLIITVLVYAYSKIAPTFITHERNTLIKSISGIFIFINALYFLNVIPPVPLALKDIGVYHNIEANPGGGYLVFGEEPSLKLFKNWNSVFHYTPGERVYVYSSIFAPTKLETTITHQWQYFDPRQNTWVSLSNISFPLTGGRDEGYRGYSFKESVFPGKWRVDVVTSRGQIVGRINFTIQMSENPPVFFREEK